MFVHDVFPGNLVDTLSVRDLRGIGSNAQNFMRLWLPVKAFKEEGICEI